MPGIEDRIGVASNSKTEKTMQQSSDWVKMHGSLLVFASLAWALAGRRTPL